jgi:DNA-binding MarR family transcriptional regulator
MQDDRVERSLPNAIVRLFRQVNRVHNRLFADHGVSAEQAHILLVLGTLGPMTIGRLQRQLSLSSATLTGAIDRLEAQGLVRRAPSAEDKRAFVIESKLSAKKQATFEAVVAEGEERCFAALTASERKELLRLLGKCIAHLDALARAH